MTRATYEEQREAHYNSRTFHRKRMNQAKKAAKCLKKAIDWINIYGAPDDNKDHPQYLQCMGWMRKAHQIAADVEAEEIEWFANNKPEEVKVIPGVYQDSYEIGGFRIDVADRPD